MPKVYKSLTIPSSLLDAVKEAGSGSVSQFITDTVKEFTRGDRYLDKVSPPKDKATSFTIDKQLVEEVNAYAKERNMSFNQAIVLMLEQVLNDK